MIAVGYIPFEPHRPSAEAAWLRHYLGCEVSLLSGPGTFNLTRNIGLPSLGDLKSAIQPMLRFPWVIAEGTGGFLWAAVLRICGFKGGLTILPYVNPICWHDVACLEAYRQVATPLDRILVGSRRSAALLQALGVCSDVGEPYGIDCDVFRRRQISPDFLTTLKIPKGRILLFAGRFEPDKCLHVLLSVGLKARLLFSDLLIVIAARVFDPDYVSFLSDFLKPEDGVYVVRNPTGEQLAALYNEADVFVTAATSHYETFGRAAAEALACGTTAIAPRYDGFCEILAQPGGVLVDLATADEADVSVDESRLLRAIYEVLDSPPAVPTDDVSAVAQARFSRTRTIHLLDYLLTPPSANRSESKEVPKVTFNTPTKWQAALNDMSRAPMENLLTSVLAGDSDAAMDCLDDEFQKAVRRFLASEIDGR